MFMILQFLVDQKRFRLDLDSDFDPNLDPDQTSFTGKYLKKQIGISVFYSVFL